MDRDIEQAADQTTTQNPTREYYQWPPTGENPPAAPPAGRGDATQPDPAMIERARQAATEAVHAKIAPDLPLATPIYESDLVEAAVEAAAALIVPATAEHIAAAIETHAQHYGPNWLGSYYDGVGTGAKIARSFAAGLSADTTGGDSDE